MLLKIAICDDEKIICNDIKNKLESMPGSHRYDISVFCDGNKLLSSKEQFDIIFLDIEINDINGMDVASFLRQKGIGTYIIFMTSHSEFMQEAFKVNAFRYLCKPVKVSEFEEAIVSAEKQLTENESVLIRSGGEIVNIKKNSIVCVEAFGDGTYIYTTDKVIESRNSLKYWTELFSAEDFFQVHKSYLIAMSYVKTIKGFEAEMSCINLTVPIAHRKMKQFKYELISYIAKKSYYGKYHI